ncbi:MAG: Efflux pump periplasmic linker BepF [Stenotrophomonas maltophilia]|uniref:Efflux pump periplasmic linker BepF n=1 Tax=Stenotrophomonas maltophilia TaxID=40324 RepID=A0A7V8FG57_STEMA|nr:MAG: Efflux pump periplasmic linker BepF [Stenotrophomonas maltophilia]
MRVRPAAVSGMIITALLISSCNRTPSQAVAADGPDVDVAPVSQQMLKTWDSFNGRVSATDAVQVLPRVGGYITQAAYREGAEVRKGDLLFVIDQRPYRNALAYANQQDTRAQQLLGSSAVSREEAEQKRSAREQGLAEVRAAESAAATAALNLQFTEVRSPIDGRTSRAQLTLGNLAVADQSVLTSVVSQNPVYVYFDPDEHSFLKYRQAFSQGSSTTVRIGLASDECYPHAGDLSFADNQLDASTGTVRARATVNNEQRLLTAGLYAKVQLSVGEPDTALLVPERAILTDQDRKYVYVLGNDNRADKRFVQTGQQVGRERVITSGLVAAEQVIVSGLQGIHGTGSPVVPHLHPAGTRTAPHGAAAQSGL